MAKVISTSNNIGGAASSVTAGGYNQGLQFAASIGESDAGINKTGKDVRGGSSNSGSGYNQGDQFAATIGGDKPGTKKDLRGGSSNPASGYNQGAQK